MRMFWDLWQNIHHAHDASAYVRRGLMIASAAAAAGSLGAAAARAGENKATERCEDFRRQISTRCRLSAWSSGRGERWSRNVALHGADGGHRSPGGLRRDHGEGSYHRLLTRGLGRRRHPRSRPRPDAVRNGLANRAGQTLSGNARAAHRRTLQRTSL